MKKTIIDYYDYTLPFYQFFWHKNKGSYAIHYGFWDSNTQNLEDALLNTNKFLAERAGIKKNDLVLDAGCGVGGSAIWIAKTINASVTGIAISTKQIDKAKELAIKNSVQEKTNFLVMDYLKTTFENSSFGVVWAIESVCHAQDKEDFIKEAYRILRKGGRLVIADGFLEREPQNEKEKQIVKDFTVGLALPNLALVEQFRESMEKVGFVNVKYWDKSNDVLPSSKRLFNMCKFGYPIARLTEKIGLTSTILTNNNLAGVVQYKALINGLGTYGVFYGEK